MGWSTHKVWLSELEYILVTHRFIGISCCQTTSCSSWKWTEHIFPSWQLAQNETWYGTHCIFQSECKICTPMNYIMWIFLTILYGMTNSVNGYLRRKEWYTDGWYIFLPMQVKNSMCNWCCPWLRTCSLSLISVLLMVLCIQQFKKCAWLMVQPWTCHGLHESWQGRCRESFRIHGQPTLADIGDSCYFLGSADVGRSVTRPVFSFLFLITGR